MKEGQHGPDTYKVAACIVEEAAINLSIYAYQAVSNQAFGLLFTHLAPVPIFFLSCFEATVPSTLLSHTQSILHRRDRKRKCLLQALSFRVYMLFFSCHHSQAFIIGGQSL